MSERNLPQDVLTALHQAKIEADLVLRVPSAADVLYLINPMEETRDSLGYFNIGTEIACLLEHRDGSRLTSAELNELLQDKAAFHAVMRLRNKLYSEAIERGRVVVVCPSCHDAQQRFELLEIALALDTAIDSPFELDGLRLREPALADVVEYRSRPMTAALLESVSVVAEHNFTVSLRRIQLCELERARAQFEVDELDPPDGKEDWVYRLPGFRALLHLALMANSAQAQIDDTELRKLEDLRITDFLFLDAVYRLLFAIEVDESRSHSIICSNCGQCFLPAVP